MTYNKNRKRFELYFDATSYSKDTDNSIAHKLADITQSAGAILSSNAEGLSFNYRASDVKYFNLIFFLQC